MNKITYEAPSMEITTFEAEDILTSSNPWETDEEY